MNNVIIIGCGAYMDSGYGCPAEWRCLKAAARGEGHFDQPVAVTGLLKCQCPGRNTIPNLKMTLKLSEVAPDAVYLSSCLAKAKPECPYYEGGAAQMADMIKANFGLPVILGTHQY
jgi:predicted metal-binding protein